MGWCCCARPTQWCPGDAELDPYYILHYTYGDDYNLEGAFTPGKVCCRIPAARLQDPRSEYCRSFRPSWPVIFACCCRQHCRCELLAAFMCICPLQVGAWHFDKRTWSGRPVDRHLKMPPDSESSV